MHYFVSYFIKICFFIIITNKCIAAEAGMPQLDPKYWASQVFWLIFLFTFLYIIIWKFLLPKITFTIENRKEKIVNDLHQAQKLNEKAKSKLDEYNKTIQESNAKAKRILAESKQKLDIELNKKKKEFNNEIEKLLKETEKQIKEFKLSSKISINKISVELAKDLVQQIVKTEVNTSNVSAIVEDVTKRKIEKYL